MEPEKEIDEEMLANLDLLLDLDVAEEEDSWDLLQDAEVSVADLENMENENE